MKPLNPRLFLTISRHRILLKSAFFVLVLFTLAEALPAQSNCNAGTSGPSASLDCLTAVALTPSGFKPASPLQPAASKVFSPNTLTFLSGDIGAEVSQIPLASPASGIIFAKNPVTGFAERLNQSFGPILTQRAQTIGRHNWYFATTYQYFLLQDIDSHALKNVGAVIYLNSQNNPNTAPPDFAGVSNNYLQLKVHQFVGYATFGLTSRVDVSVAVPLLRVDLSDTFAESFVRNPACTTGCASAPSNLSGTRAGEATGVGDVVLATKVNVWKLRRAEVDHGGLSLGVEVRLPTGDSHNFLGSGTIGVKPFATLSYAGRISPHFNIGYLANGSIDPYPVTSSSGTVLKDGLPNRLIYSGGADIALFRRLTVNLDGIAQYVFNAQSASVLPKGTSVFSQNNTTIPVIQPITSSYTRADATGGLKLNPFKGFLITGNVSVKLNQAGLRSRVVPLMGASLTF